MSRMVLLIASFFLRMDPAVDTHLVEEGVEACIRVSQPPFDWTTCAAVAYLESRFDSQAVGPVLRSGRQAKGMLQVITAFVPVTRDWPDHAPYDTWDVHTPEGSVAYGMGAFGRWYGQTGRLDTALCHYAGGNVCAKGYAVRVLELRDQVLDHTIDRVMEAPVPW